jgi:hypothetical protein
MNIRALVMAVVVLVGGSVAANAQNLTIVKSVIASGGNVVTNGQFTMGYTIGQAVIGTQSSSPFSLYQGFWTPTMALTGGVKTEFAGDANGLSLDQNYPNPFNPSTKIRFSIPDRMKVTLRVMNLLGEEVYRVIDQETKEAGMYVVDFDAKDLPSGTYVYRLEANNSVLAKRMVLMK